MILKLYELCMQIFAALKYLKICNCKHLMTLWFTNNEQHSFPWLFFTFYTSNQNSHFLTPLIFPTVVIVFFPLPNLLSLSELFLFGFVYKLQTDVDGWFMFSNYNYSYCNNNKHRGTSEWMVEHGNFYDCQCFHCQSE